MIVTRPRYRLHAYVCDHGCAHASQLTGWAKFEMIFQQRPDGCRYAIAETSPGRFEVWDLYDDAIDRQLMYQSMLTNSAIGLAPPDALWTGSQPDALVVKTVALYGRR